MAFLSDLWVKIAAIGGFILALLLGYRYITRRSYERGVRQERTENLVSAYDALKDGNDAERDFKGSIDENETVEGIYLRGDDFVWVSDSPSGRDK